MNWNDTSVLVTGAGGFIGSHLTERLVERGAEVRAFVQYNSLGRRGWLDFSPVEGEIEVVAGDVTDRDSVRAAMEGVEVVFHLAALIAIPYSYRAPRSYVRTNVDGTLNVLQAARELGTRRVVHTSTSEVYGSAQYVPIDEAHPLQGQSPYAASKIGADQMAAAFHRSFEVPVATVRPFNTYGPRQSERAVIPTIISQALTQPRLALGNLAPTRDFNYVEDTAGGFIAVAECDEAVGEVLNLGTGEEISIGELAETIAALVGKDLAIENEERRMRPEESEVDRLCADAARAKRLTGWAPEHDLRDGLEKTIAWLDEHQEQYRPEAYVV